LLTEGDPTRLSQVFGNLLNNAAKYTPPGGSVWLTVQVGPQEVAVSVRDSGIGIPSEMLPRVFDLFTQLDHSLDRAQGGLGIGLTLVHRLVGLHGGSVQALSAGSGQGSEFIVRLPLRGQLVDRPAKDIKAPAPVPIQRVLVVDDNVDAADSLALLLRVIGHETRIAHDGLEALVAARAFLPDVVLLDIGLPGMDGYEVARQLRGEPDLRTALLIAQTGYGQDEDRRRSREAGFDHHLVKPVDPDALRALLARHQNMRVSAYRPAVP
jgi:CheY-like chemotaxis protein